MEVEAYADPERRLIELRAEAVRLGYVQGRSDSKPCKCGCQSFVYFVAEAGIFSTATPNECYRKDKHPQAVCSFCSRPKETVQGQADRPAVNRLLQDCDIKCKTVIPNCDRAFVRCTAANPAAQGEGEG
jgi:hypothetical protein